ncbi:MAG: GspH/FimT family pseudopilin [Rhodocyclales bacterium]|nr:GspH/FimT family pseudopilin [Rhodocyclales bacterium]
MRSSRGFTLIELMITVAILAILLGVGVPSFVDYIRNSRTSTQVNELATALNTARSEAIARGVPVSVSACSVAPDVSPNDCAAGGLSFEQGWCIHLGDAGAAPAATCTAANQLRRHEGMLEVVVAPAVPSLTFGRLGQKTSPAGEIALSIVPKSCPPGSAVRARILSVSPGGRVSVVRTSCP